MILVFTHKVSNSLLYVLDHIFSKQWNEDYEITQDENHYKNSQAHIKIHYANVDLIGIEGHWIPNSNFLFTENFGSINLQKDMPIGTVKFPKNITIDDNLFQLFNILSIDNQSINLINHTFSERKVYFPFESKIGFDVFAHVFALIANVEEVLLSTKPFKTDEHGRFETSQLKYVQENMHLLPMADIAIQRLQDELNIHPKKQNQFQIIPTADVDQCFQFQGKSAKRFWGGFIAHPKTARNRIQFLMTKKDKFNPSITLKSFLSQNPLSRIFWLCHSETSSKNKQISRENIDFQHEIALSKTYSNIGLHPSFQNENQSTIFKDEKEWLEKITGETMVHSRQHYLNFSLPKTYETLEKIGIKNDWSMGFSNTIGFRNGTTFPIQWYNIIDNKITNITVHSFSLMDVTCKNYLKLNSLFAIQLSISIKQIIQSINGKFCFIIHNESLSETEGWAGWKQTLESWESTI
jgi:hypothetical protein